MTSPTIAPSMSWLLPGSFLRRWKQIECVFRASNAESPSAVEVEPRRGGPASFRRAFHKVAVPAEVVGPLHPSRMKDGDYLSGARIEGGRAITFQEVAVRTG